MRKKLFVVSLAFVLFGAFGVSVTAADLKFKPDGGGYFIYCNNNEFIRRMDLADTSNPEPSYIMNNTNMTNGKYTIYFSHVNHTELPSGESRPEDTADMNINSFTAEDLEKYYTDDECGFDIECDVEFKAKTDTKIRITALGFEVQQPLNYYYTNQFIRYEDPWACLGAVADYMQRPIFDAGGVGKVYPKSFDVLEVEIAAGESAWLSEYIENYSVVPWLKPVHLLADFEILYGCTDVNVAALRALDTLGDRSEMSENAAFAKYYRDRQYKGVADTLPSVTAKLEYKIDDTMADGERLPVTVYNQYVPEGNEVYEWITHINPQGDKAVNRVAAESDMLCFEYFDPSKKLLYGDAVPKSERDCVWKFDVFHSDTKKFDPTAGVATKETFKPNYELDLFKSNTKTSGNYANYCVKTNYSLSVKNDGSRTRYFKYRAKTTAGIVVSVLDSEGKYVSENATHKVYDAVSKDETLACVELAPNTETKFTIEVFLPINYVGGIKNSFVISDNDEKIQYPEDMKQGTVLDPDFTGRDFVKWDGGALLRSDDGENWDEISVSDEVRKIFEGNYKNFKIEAVSGGYAAMWYSFVPTPSYYAPWLKYKSDIYFFDSDFALKGSANLGSYPWEMTEAGGKIVVKADKVYESADGGETWSESGYSGYNLPHDTGCGIVLAPKTLGDVYFSPDGGENLYKIAYRADVKPPRYVDVLGDLFFFAEGSDISFSRDGVEWVKVSVGEKIEKLSRVGNEIIVNEIIVNETKHFEIPDVPSYVNVVLDGEVMQYDKQVRGHDYGVAVPLEMSMEKIGAEYDFDSKRGKVTIDFEGKHIELSIGSNMIKTDGEKSYMSFGTSFESDRVFIPARDVFEALGFESEYFEDAKCLVISRKNAE